VDLDAVVARRRGFAVAKRLDVDAVVAQVVMEAVLGRLDLRRVAITVVTAIDLPEIVREATEAAAYEVVRGTRAERAQADTW
jgi:hypothetical protein